MLEVQGLNFLYNNQRTVLRNVSFCLNKGDFFCLLGPNGTGKTTLLRCILGLTRMQSGAVFLNGQNISGISSRQRAHYLAYMPQSSELAFNYRALEVVMMGRISYLPFGASPVKKDTGIALEAMERLGILELAHRVFQELSGGERQMILLARAIAQQAEVLIMDEPAANLDYGNQVKLLKVAKSLVSQNYTVLMTTHSPEHAFLVCNRAALMYGGEIIAEGPPEKVISGDALSNLYQTPVRVIEISGGGGNNVLRSCIPLMDD